MANLTISVDDQLLRDARIKAVQQGTSVNEVCRQAIERFALGDEDDTQARMAQLRAVAARVRRSAAGAPLWPGRSTLYEEALDARRRARSGSR